jgi:hypothetical protein
VNSRISGLVPVLGYATDGPRLALAPPEEPVTVIAALRESEESVLLAVDSGETESHWGLRSLASKLHRNAPARLAWALAGNPEIGEQGLNEWLLSHSGPPPDWDEFVYALAERVAMLNGRERQLTKLSGARGSAQDTAELLLVAWSNGPRMVEINDKGRRTTPAGDFCAIGTGGLHAWIAYEAVSMASTITHMPHRLRFVVAMMTAAHHAPACSPPVRGVQVTRDAVTDLDQIAM